MTAPRRAFDVSPAAYDRFMGRYSERLAPRFADFAAVDDALPVVDVGCGTGALTAELARRVGPESVAAVDPAEHFVDACRARVPGADVRVAPAEQLPFADASAGAALSQLVLAFVRDAPAAVAELARVVRPGGVVAACMWAADGRFDMLRVFWQAAEGLGDGAGPRTPLRFRAPAEFVELAEAAGLHDLEADTIAVEADYTGFDDWWDALADAAGPTGTFYAALGPDARDELRRRCRTLLGDPRGPFALTAEAWAVRAIA